MTAPQKLCPRCGSSLVASRRQLFHALVADLPLSGAFNWYTENTPGAFPPRSLFVVLLAMMGVVALPAAAMWMGQAFTAFHWALWALLVLLAGLVYDLCMTHRRYRAWRTQWLCGECRCVFTLTPLPAKCMRWSPEGLPPGRAGPIIPKVAVTDSGGMPYGQSTDNRGP